MEKRKNSLVDYEFYYWIYKNDLELWSKLTDASKEYESEALITPVVGVTLCDHDNEVMRQGDGFTYVVCGDCGRDL